MVTPREVLEELALPKLKKIAQRLGIQVRRSVGGYLTKSVLGVETRQSYIESLANSNLVTLEEIDRILGTHFSEIEAKETPKDHAAPGSKGRLIKGRLPPEPPEQTEDESMEPRGADVAKGASERQGFSRQVPEGPKWGSAVPQPLVPLSMRVEALERGLTNRTTKERVLHAWSVIIEQYGTRTDAVLVATQERGVVLRPAGSDFAPMGMEFKWEHVTNLEAEMSPTRPVVRVNDGRREFQFIHPQADLIASLLTHLKWSREGYATGYIDEHGFDSELVHACRGDLQQGRYADVVSNAFRLLETRIRRDSAADASLHGVDLINYAFNAETGKIRLGRTGAEREGLNLLFRGAFLWFRDTVAHRFYLSNFGKEEAFEALALVDLLLKLSQRASEALR